MPRRGEAGMNWLRRKIKNWLDNDRIYSIKGSDVASTSPSGNGMSFNLYNAVGGHILETRRYDERADRNISTLYMVHEDDDFADQVAKAIMIEMMKQ